MSDHDPEDLMDAMDEYAEAVNWWQGVMDEVREPTKDELVLWLHGQLRMAATMQKCNSCEVYYRLSTLAGNRCAGCWKERLGLLEVTLEHMVASCGGLIDPSRITALLKTRAG